MIHLFTNMSIVNFTSYKPLFVNDGEESIKLIFEPTIYGYTKAVEWLEAHAANAILPIKRVVIPYASDGCIDVGDYLLIEDTSPLVVHYSLEMYDPKDKFDVVDISSEQKDESLWPFASTSCITDFKLAAKHLLDTLLIRDVYSGLNDIQEYMMKYANVHEPGVIIAMASAHWKLPLKTIRCEFAKLKQGNHPLFDDPKEPLPHLLVNGPKPLGVSVIQPLLKIAIKRSEHPDWSKIPPRCKDHVFQATDIEGVFISPVILKGGYVVAFPYGVSAETIVLNTMHTWGEKPQYTSDFPIEATRVTWDPVFKQGSFTMNEYADAWVERRLDIFVEVISKEEDEKVMENTRKSFLHSIIKGQRCDDHDPRLKYIDETLAEKRQRVYEEFNDVNGELLKLPISKIDKEYVFTMDEITFVPQHKNAVDMLIEQILLITE